MNCTLLPMGSPAGGRCADRASLVPRYAVSTEPDDPRGQQGLDQRLSIEHSIAQVGQERGLRGWFVHGGRDSPGRLRPAASAAPVNRTQRELWRTSKGKQTHGMERVLPCRKRLGSTTDSSVEQRLEVGRCAGTRLILFVGNGGLRRLVGPASARRRFTSCESVVGPLSQTTLAFGLAVDLASTSVRMRSGGCKARAFRERRTSEEHCWVQERRLGVNSKGATAAVTRCGCRRGEVFGGYLRTRESDCDEATRSGILERFRTP